MQKKSPEQCLQELVKNHGSTIYENSSFFNILMDTLPWYPKLLTLLKFACDENIPTILLASNEKNYDEKKSVIEKAIEILIDKYCMQSEIAKQVVLILSSGLGWNIPENLKKIDSDATLKVDTDSENKKNKQDNVKALFKYDSEITAEKRSSVAKIIRNFGNIIFKKCDIILYFTAFLQALIYNCFFYIPIFANEYKSLSPAQLGFYISVFVFDNFFSFFVFHHFKILWRNKVLPFTLDAFIKILSIIFGLYFISVSYECVLYIGKAFSAFALIMFVISCIKYKKMSVKEKAEMLAERGDSNAQFCLGMMYYKGEGVKQDYEKSKEWFEKSAVQGDSSAQFRLGYMYGKGEGVEQNYAMEKEWYEKSAAQGNSAARFNLGVMYNNGEGVERNYAMARVWYEKAATQGEDSASNALGNMYYSGRGVSKDYAKARVWYEKSASRGNSSAQFSLGEMYYNGKGVGRDYTMAKKWYEKSASQGNSSAQYALGVMYENGSGVSQDYMKAKEWYEKSAAQGHSAAQCKLGHLYLEGYGVDRNLEKAKELWEKSAAQGNELAEIYLKTIFS